MSRAVVNWPLAGRPLGFLKKLRVMPRSRAFPFIRFTNPSTLPPMYSATATEASLAETTAMPLSSSASGISLPAWRNIFDPPVRPAFRLIFTRSEGWTLPSRIASSAR